MAPARRGQEGAAQELIAGRSRAVSGGDAPIARQIARSSAALNTASQSRIARTRARLFSWRTENYSVEYSGRDDVPARQHSGRGVAQPGSAHAWGACGRRFKSGHPDTSVSRVPHLAENRSKTARVRAICDRAWTRRVSPARLIAKIRQILSLPDFARSQCTPGETPSHVGATEPCVLRTAGRAEAPAREGDSREHGYQTWSRTPRQPKRQDDRCSHKLAPSRSTGSARSEKARRCQTEGRAALENQKGRASAAAVIACGVRSGKAGLQILRQR
jgi:hypothetical protein